MNKTVVFITFGALAALGLTGTLILQIVRPEASAIFTSFVIQTLGLASVAAATFYGLGKANDKLDTVQQQTNGNLSRLQAENERLTNIIISAGLDTEGHGR